MHAAQRSGVLRLCARSPRASTAEKKPKGKDLKLGEKRHNRKLARVRVRAEHAIAGIKICRIAKDVFRNLAEGSSDLAVIIAASLHNLRRARRRYRHKTTNAYFE